MAAAALRIDAWGEQHCARLCCQGTLELTAGRTPGSPARAASHAELDRPPGSPVPLVTAAVIPSGAPPDTHGPGSGVCGGAALAGFFSISTRRGHPDDMPARPEAEPSWRYPDTQADT